MKQLFSVLWLLLSLSITTYGEVINVADYGFQPGKDVTYEINYLIESLSGRKDLVCIFLPRLHNSKAYHRTMRIWIKTASITNSYPGGLTGEIPSSHDP